MIAGKRPDPRADRLTNARNLVFASCSQTTMLPFIGTERIRKINLGGVSGASSATDLLDSVKSQREARLESKRRQDAAIRIQSCWRGRSEVGRTKKKMRETFENDPLGITGLRCLVLLGSDQQALATWSRTIVASPPGAWISLDLYTAIDGLEDVFRLASSPHATSWLILVQKAALLLLRSVSKTPRYGRVLERA